MVHKGEQLALYKANTHFVLFSTEEVRATISGNIAIVTGRLLSKSKTGSIIGRTRFLFVYTKQNEKWKITVGQDTIVIED